MPVGGPAPLEVPKDSWERGPVIEALAGRDIALLFRLLKRYLGASQGKIGAATSLDQSDVSKIMNDRRTTTSFERIERIAAGLDMPDDARVRLGLAPLSYAPPSAGGFRVPPDQSSVIIQDSSGETEVGYGAADAADIAIGETIRRLRGSLSLRGLAERAHINAGHLSKLENGKRRLTPEFATVLDEALDSGGELARLADSRKPVSRTSTSMSAPSGSGDHKMITIPARDFWETGYDSGEELMRRRAFLANVAALTGLGAADTPAAIEAIRQELNLSFAEERAAADVDEWQEIALEYGESYPVLAPAELIRSLTVDMCGLQLALRRHTGIHAQRDLFRVTALLSAFTAQTITNMGQAHDAMRWWRTAKTAADRSRDSYSALWVRSREIVRAMESRPVPTILRMIEDAEGISDSAPPEASLELIAGKAQTLALAGRERDAFHALGQLEERFGELQTGYSGSVLSWGQERLHNTESFIYSRLGYLTKTEAARTDGRALYDMTNVRWPAGLELNLAFCLVRNGDVTEGLNHAQALIVSLPGGQRDNPIIDDARKLLRLVPLKDHRSAEVQQYREWVTYSIPQGSKEYENP